MKILTERYGTVGWEEFLQTKKDILREYDSSKEMTKNRPVKTEHGNTGEAAFRKWLINYLPEKYGVTSGYIIPNLRAIEYSLNHFDVIVYDKINSPILWIDANSDKSDYGKRRAIPAEYVYTVFEIKSTFNGRSIDQALKKLDQINLFAKNLNKSFSSAIVFIEVKLKEQRKCELAEKLFRKNIFGYYGGVILRAERLDDNITGYFQFYDYGKTEKTMPLVKDIKGLIIDEQNRPIITKQGDFCEIKILDNMLHFNNGYSPRVENVDIFWSYNSFPNFAIDILDRLNGRFNSKNHKRKMSYGMSFLKF